MKKIVFIIFFIAHIIGAYAQTANVSITNVSASGGSLFFDIEISTSGSDIYLGNSDYKLSFTGSSFNSPTLSYVSGSNNLIASDGSSTMVSVLYEPSSSLLSNVIRVNIQNPNPSSSNFNSRVAKIATNSINNITLGKFQITGLISQTHGLTWICGSTLMYSMSTTGPNYLESQVSVTCINPPSAILPLTLLSFDAEKKGEKVETKWQTEQEVNTDYFEVERSTNGVNFSSIGQVKATGLKQKSTYSLTDNTPPQSNTLYYRLKMLDKDGSFDYSKIKSISSKASKGDIKIYPNPISNTIKAELTSITSGDIDISIVDAFGKVVLTSKQKINEGLNTLNLDCPHLAAGMYLLVAKTGADSFVQKIVKF